MALVSTVLKALSLGIVNVFALFGNISLFVVLLRKPALRTQTNIFLLNLAAADLLVSVVNMPMANATLVHGSWMFGEFVCTLTAFVNLLSLVASVMSLAMVSVNRYHFVVKWRTYHLNFSKLRCTVYVICVWLLSGVLCLPPLLGWAEYRYNAGQSQCFVNWSSSASYTIFMVGVCFFGPLTTMASLYWKIWKFNRASTQCISSWNTARHNQMSDDHTGPKSQNIVAGSNIVRCEADAQSQAIMHEIPTGRRLAICSETANQQPNGGCSLEHLDELRAYKTTENTLTVQARGLFLTSRSPESDVMAETQLQQQLEKQEQPQDGVVRNQNVPDSNIRSDSKLTRTLMIVVLVFCICLAPYAFTIVLEHFLPTPLPTAVSFGVLLLGYANSACNVVIYIGTCASIRKEFKNLFKGCF